MDFDVIVVGAGFSGLYMLHRLRQLGLTAHVFEAGGGVGGTWYWNRYPGARCDVESIEYSYGFDEDLEQSWEWTERFAGQPEILRYLEHVADRFELWPDISVDSRVTGATWDDDSHSWTVTVNGAKSVRAKYLVMATGCLSSANTPDIPGRDAFGGPTYHTGRWPHEGVDFSGQRVAVIGTGSSAVQSIPIIAEQAASLVVFQRTPTYSVPARNRPLDPGELESVKADYKTLRDQQKVSAAGFSHAAAEQGALEVDEATRSKIFQERWEGGGLHFLGSFNDLIITPGSNEAAAEFVRTKIRETVKDPAVAEKLVPKQVIGCKRLCIDSGYYETFNLPHVTLVDISDGGIEAITPTGVRAGSEEYEVDAIVFATGFDAMTGALFNANITGRNGVHLRDAWSEGPKTYLGLATPGFPNMFTVTGPGSPSVLTNMVVSIELHVEWITDCIRKLEDDGVDTIEAEAESAEQWVNYVNGVAALTLFPHCNSWYLGANVPGKPRVFMPLPGHGPYAEQVASVAQDNYRGFALV
jgi:cyclohexanone monooxygenase